MHNQIRQAINSNLSSLSVTPRLHQDILAGLQGGPKLKRKMPLALAIALSLLLITAVALAAVILGGKDVVDQFIAPMAQQNDRSRFSEEEVGKILQFATEHGIQLDELYLKRIKNEGTYFKDELAMIFAKEQLGFYPGTWSIEDQHWYAQLTQQFQPDIVVETTLPQEGELSQQQIEEAAQAYILKQIDKDLQPLNPEHFRLERGFTEIRINPWYKERKWNLSFTPLTLDDPYIRLELTPQGVVLSQYTDLHELRQGSPEEKAGILLNRFHNVYSNIYGSRDSWSQQTWQLLKAKLEALAPDPDKLRHIKHVLLQHYDIPENAISREQAVEAAAQAVSSHFKVDKAQLLDTTRGKLPPESMVYALYLRSGDQQRWKVSFENSYLAEVDALTGQVLITDVYSPGNDFERRYTLDVLIPADKKAYATPRPVYDMSDEALDQLAREQQFFKTDLNMAPQYFWDALQGIGYNVKTASGVFSRLYRDYGLEDRYWPILYQAMYAQKEYRPQAGEIMPGLPAPTDLQQEEAVQTAYQAAVKAAHGKLDADYIMSLKPVVLFTFNLHGPGSRTWQIDLVDTDKKPGGVDIVYVALDAITKNLLSARLMEPEQPMPSQGDYSPGQEPWSRMGADGRPSVWGSDKAPKAFWDYMEQHYNTRPLVEAALLKWTAEHGKLVMFWPQEAKAVFNLWILQNHPPEWNESNLTFLGLPDEHTLSQQQAEQTAWQRFKEAVGNKYSQEDYDHIRLNTTLVYDQRGSMGAVWQIEFADGRRDYNTTLGDLILDAGTGEVIEINTDIGNG